MSALQQTIIPLQSAISSLVSKGWSIKKQIEQLESELKTINDQLVSLSPASTLPVPGSEALCIVGSRTTISIDKPEPLKKMLGDRFEDLVLVKQTYKPSERLLQLAEVNPKLQKTLTYKTTQVVAYRAK